VLAARLNVGAQFGSGYPDAKRFSIGQTPNEATQVRGFRDEDFDLTRSYATASFEYRYDFNLTTLATQTLIAIAFTDVAWTGGATDTALVASGGVGLQLNLGFSGVNLPALRFDYGSTTVSANATRAACSPSASEPSSKRNEATLFSLDEPSAPKAGGLHVEQDVHHVAIVHDVAFAFGAQQALRACRCDAARLHQHVPTDHLGANEAALHVTVNLAGRLRGR